jgi:hypothetical protein
MVLYFLLDRLFFPPQNSHIALLIRKVLFQILYDKQLPRILIPGCFEFAFEVIAILLEDSDIPLEGSVVVLQLLFVFEADCHIAVALFEDGVFGARLGEFLFEAVCLFD